MKNPTLMAGVALLGIAIGFVAGDVRGRASGRSAEDGASLSSDGPGRPAGDGFSSRRRGDGEVNGRNGSSTSYGEKDFSKLSAAQAFALMRARKDFFWDGDPLEVARRDYEYQLMLSQLSLPVLEKTLELAIQEGVPMHQISAAFSVLASKDLERALAWAATQPNEQVWRAAACSGISQNDPERAAEMIQEDILKGNQMTGQSAIYGLTFSTARQGKDALLQFLDTLPASMDNYHLASGARALPKEDLPGFLTEIEKRVAEGKLQKWTMGNILQNLAMSDPEAVRKVIDQMVPGPEKAKQEIGFAGTLRQQGRVEEANALVKKAMAAQVGQEKDFFLQNAGSLMHQGPELVKQMADALPEGVKLTVDEVTQLRNHSFRADSVVLAQILKSPEDQAAFLETAIGQLDRNFKPNANDYRVLEHRLQTLGLADENKARVEAALAASKEKVLGK